MLSDPIAQGIYDHHYNGMNNPIIIHSHDFDDDEVLPSYFFRSFSEMPNLEQSALKMAKGSILDIGACAGCHSIYLQSKGFNVTALEYSRLCCDVMIDRKIKNVICADIFEYSGQQYNTILLLMNGTGIAGKLKNLTNFLIKIKSLLANEGQILIDSSDLIYLYINDEGNGLIDLNSDKYYGEITFQTEYNSKKGSPFSWLYVDKETLANHALEAGLEINDFMDGENYNYLAILKHADR